MTVVIHAMRLPRGVTNSTRSALSVLPARESAAAPSRPRASAMAAAGESISSAAGAPRVALLTGDPPSGEELAVLGHRGRQAVAEDRLATDALHPVQVVHAADVDVVALELERLEVTRGQAQRVVVGLDELERDRGRLLVALARQVAVEAGQHAHRAGGAVDVEDRLGRAGTWRRPWSHHGWRPCWPLGRRWPWRCWTSRSGRRSSPAPRRTRSSSPGCWAGRRRRPSVRRLGRGE